MRLARGRRPGAHVRRRVREPRDQARRAARGGRGTRTASPSPRATSSAGPPSSPACSTTSRRSSRSTRWAWTSPASATTSSTRAPTELLRMQEGGCHPVDGCYFPDQPYAGADFPWLAANVVKKDGSGTLLPGTWVKEIAGTKVGFIGMTLEATPTIVNPSGRLDRRLQGRGRDGQRPGGGAEEAGRQGDRRPHARGRPQQRHLQPVRRHLRADRDDGDASSAPRSTRSSRVTPTTRTSAPSPTRPATRAS